MWLAGGGVKGGIGHGATDEFGWHAVEDKVHVHDLHATILHLMGIDHEKLTYRYSGRDYRLTDVSGQRGEGHPGVSMACKGRAARSWVCGLTPAPDSSGLSSPRGPVHECPCP